MSSENVTRDRLKEVFHYCSDTGVFTRILTSAGVRVGAVAKCVSSNGYIVIRIDDRLYGAHRLAWLYVHGVMPAETIDHIDGDRKNNAISNLREASQKENSQNMGARKNNASGFPGVSWDSQTKNWAAQIMCEGKTIRLGRFQTKELAYSAYVSAKKKKHPFAHAKRLPPIQAKPSVEAPL